MASEIVGVGGAYNFPYLVKRRQMGGRGWEGQQKTAQ